MKKSQVLKVLKETVVQSNYLIAVGLTLSEVAIIVSNLQSSPIV